jgi:exopolyphosphatase/guanosine-5'-triphosphate,3'-diphosphate pyrophosphatase
MPPMPQAQQTGREGPDAATPPAVARDPSLFAAIDLGTNNCRLLIAAPAGRGFRVVESFSRIVRLGDGLTRTGRLDDEAMNRAVAALRICADKVRRRRPLRIRAVATQACRSASNGEAFVERVAAETGLRLAIISPKEEAQLSVAGCLTLLDRTQTAALVVDVGGGSTELSWVDLTDPRMEQAHRLQPSRLPIRAWISIPLGVVSLAERFPEGAAGDRAWYRSMVDHIKGAIGEVEGAAALRPAFDAGNAHLIGTSGAITSLAGLHLDLERYDRNRVDGLWLTRGDCEAAAERLLVQDAATRASQPCIGPDRADLVLAGAAILQAVQELWPCERVRVADRGLREGLLLALMQERPSRRRRRRPRGAGPAVEAARA